MRRDRLAEMTVVERRYSLGPESFGNRKDGQRAGLYHKRSRTSAEVTPQHFLRRRCEIGLGLDGAGEGEVARSLAGDVVFRDRLAMTGYQREDDRAEIPLFVLAQQTDEVTQSHMIEGRRHDPQNICNACPRLFLSGHTQVHPPRCVR